MKLDLYAAHKKILTFVQWHPVDHVTACILPAKKDCYAIHGGANHNEGTIRKWANEQGFRVKKIMEPEDREALESC